MKKFIIVYICAILCVFSYNVEAFNKSIVEKSNVHIIVETENMYGICNGVVIQNEENYSTILTAKHCTQNVLRYYIEDKEGVLIQTSEFNDLAFLIIFSKLKNKKPVQFIKKRQSIGSKVYYLGESNGLIINEYGRIISNSFYSKSTTSLHIIKGCSGGGVFNDNNELVGIVVSGYFGSKSPKAITSTIENINAINYFLNNEVNSWLGNLK